MEGKVDYDNIRVAIVKLVNRLVLEATTNKVVARLKLQVSFLDFFWSFCYLSKVDKDTRPIGHWLLVNVAKSMVLWCRIPQYANHLNPINVYRSTPARNNLYSGSSPINWSYSLLIYL